jgi:hypothetical protein
MAAAGTHYNADSWFYMHTVLTEVPCCEPGPDRSDQVSTNFTTQAPCNAPSCKDRQM